RETKSVQFFRVRRRAIAYFPRFTACCLLPTTHRAGMINDQTLDRAAQAIAEAGALLIGAGAGMGVDSGLPDFRGTHRFWCAHPRYERLGLDFVSLANPRWFDEDPTLAWGFYGHRMEMYRQTSPHAGFEILRRWTAELRQGSFVFTSNVDGQFQRAGFAA